MKKVKITLSVMLLLAFLGLSESYGQWLWNAPHIYNQNSGNVGIGINTPGYLLHVSKNMVAPSIRIQNAGGTGGASFDMVDDFSSANWKFKATNAGGFKIRDHAYGMDVIQVEPNSRANTIYVDAVGDVGLGGDATERLDLFESDSHYPFVCFNPTADGNGGLLFKEESTTVGWIWRNGSFDRMYFSNDASSTRPDITIASDGRVGIGTSSPATGYTLSVNGKAVCTEVLVDAVADWPDYVFSENYNLISLTELEKSINENNHLPGIPSAAEAEENGVLLGEMQKQLLQKVEELTLYTIELNKQITALKKDYEELKQASLKGEE